MIPSNINREHVLKAIREIQKDGIPPGRSSKKFYILFEGEKLPPKYVISLANRFVNGRELDSSQFGGGQETNSFLKRLGFDIRSISGADVRVKSVSTERISFGGMKKTTSAHNERCPECKKTVRILLEKIYGNVHQRYKFDVETRPEEFEDTLFYGSLKAIFEKLRNYRGYSDFVRAFSLPACDFFVPDPGFIVEFDESQHFTIPRKLSLFLYPDELTLGFSKTKWIRLCDEIQAKDNDPPFRDEQRA